MTSLKTLYGLLVTGVLTLGLSPAAQAQTARVETDAVQSTTTTANVATTVDEWFTQIAQSQVTITDIRIETTDAGLQLVLETAEGALVEPVTSVQGNALILEIPNAVLSTEGLEAFAPVEAIALVEVSPSAGDRIQIVITGADALPEVAVGSDAAGLTLSVVPGVAQAGETEEAIQLLVTGEEEEGYAPADASTATRTDTPLRDVPQSIQVVPRAVIEDQQVVRLDDALRNVSGVSQNSADPRGQRFQVRGFDSSNLLRDGFNLNFGGSFGNSGFQGLSNIERIEVLKGPAAILYGTSQPGGVINLVTERPLSEPFYEIEFSAGSRGLIEPGIDLSVPLTEDGRLLSRLNALYRREDYYRDFDVPVERFFIAPVFQGTISDRTELLVNFEYLNDRRPADFGLVAVGDRVADIPLDRNLGERDDEITAESVRASYQLEHRLSDDWTFNNAFSVFTYDTVYLAAESRDFDEATGLVSRAFIQGDQPSTQYELQANVTGQFDMGSIGHQILAGVDYQSRRAGNIFRGDYSNLNTIDIFDPVYGATPRPKPEDEPLGFDGDTGQERVGLYFQDQVELFENLKLLAGIRYDAVWQNSNFRPSVLVPDGAQSSQFTDAFSPRVGLIYQPIEELSLYGSFSRSFFPNSATTVAGDILPPQRGEQFEAGIRGEFLDGRLIGNLALFNLTRQNLPTSDPNNPQFSVATGEQRSRGVELDIAGEILPGWNMIANYAYLDAEITEDDDIPEGNRLFNVPEHSFNIWTNYQIQSGDLEGLGFGVGLNYVGDRFGDDANSFGLDSYFLTNAAISYERNNWKAALNFQNLFDVDYIQATENRRTGEIYPGQEFTVVGTVSVEF